MYLIIKMPKFSVITPVHVWSEERRDGLYRAIKSLENQTFKDFELILINDGSTLEFKVPKYEWIKVINKNHEERVVAYNAGFKEARGDWFTLLDSDDEYDKEYLQRCVDFIQKWPRYRMFNFGCRYINKDGGERKRDCFEPKRKKVGHVVFGGGNIVNGTFIWHRSVYDKLGGFPDQFAEIDVPWYDRKKLNMCSPYDFSAAAQVEFPEIQPFFQVKHPDHPAGLIREIGNPWGQDYYIFYKYTRMYQSKPVKGEFIYIVHPR